MSTVVVRRLSRSFFYPLFLLLSIVNVVAVANDRPKRALLTDEQKGVVSYFEEVALGFEYGNVPAVTRKWKNSMKVFVAGTLHDDVKAELISIVEEVNSLVKDGFHIEIVKEREDANMLIYFGNQSTYAQMFPRQAGLLKGASGLCTVSWNGNNEIIRGHIFVRTERNSVEEQRHVIREELTQALGFGKDSPRYTDSIFQSSFTLPTKYAEIDKELIRLLYNPEMTPGLYAAEVDAVLTKILLTGNGA